MAPYQPYQGGVDPSLYASTGSVGDIYGAPSYELLPTPPKQFLIHIQNPIPPFRAARVVTVERGSSSGYTCVFSQVSLTAGVQCHVVTFL